MKYYHMIVEKDGKRKEHISPKQGSAPAGWKCIGVCGYHEAPQAKEGKHRGKTNQNTD